MTQAYWTFARKDRHSHWEYDNAFGTYEDAQHYILNFADRSYYYKIEEVYG